jgi:hypothetical protein
LIGFTTKAPQIHAGLFISRQEKSGSISRAAFRYINDAISDRAAINQA